MIQKNKQTKNKKFRSCRRGDCYVREFFISCVTAPIAVHSVFAMLLLQICFQIVQHYLIAIGIHVYSFYLWVKDPPEFFLDPVGIRSCFISFHLADLLSGSPFHKAPVPDIILSRCLFLILSVPVKCVPYRYDTAPVCLDPVSVGVKPDPAGCDRMIRHNSTSLYNRLRTFYFNLNSIWSPSLLFEPI